MRSQGNRVRSWSVARSNVDREEPDKQRSTRSARAGEKANEDAHELELETQEEIRSSGGDAARGNYLSMHRPDLQFSAKEISRAMSKPTRKDQRRIVRLASYPKKGRNQRIKQEFEFRTLDDTLTVHTDSDWAPA